MKFLITGCAGFIGFSITKRLLRKNTNEIIGVDIISDYYSTDLKKKRLSILKKNKNFKFIKQDLTKNKKIETIFKKSNFDIVIHLAAQPGVRQSMKYPRKYYDSNITAFFNVLELSRKFKIRKILFASSSSVYGDNKSFPLIESFKRRPKNFYALTKCINEDMAEYYSKSYGMNIIGLRFFTVYGPYGRPDMLIWKLCENVFNNKKLKINNFGHHERDFTFIDDVVTMIEKIIKQHELTLFEIYNVCSNRPSKLKSILNNFDKFRKDKLQKNIQFQEFQSGDVIKTHGSHNKLKKKINSFFITDIKKGILKTIKWFKKNYSN